MNDVWAWDFRMPSGVPIVAAADGTVRLARGDSVTGGCDPSFAPQANYIVISHAGGLETQYLHLESVVVAAGDKVRAGDLLGYSGKTGWACGSHLHFKVARPDGAAWNNPSVPARIKGYGDPVAESWVAAPQCEQGRAQVAEAKASSESSKPVTAAISPGAQDTAAAVGKTAAVVRMPAVSRAASSAPSAAPARTSGGDTSHETHSGSPVVSGTGATE